MSRPIPRGPTAQGRRNPSQPFARMRRRYLLALGSGFGLGFCPFGIRHAAATGGALEVTVHFQDRPPYSGLGPDGRPEGLLVDVVARALAEAGLRARWQLTPAQRQLTLVQQGHGADCGLGWFRNANRAAKGRFSQAIYRDRPLVAVARSAQLSAAPKPLQALLADPHGPLLVKAGYSYGDAIDRVLAGARTPVEATHAEPVQMVRMLLAGRVGWLLMAPEEAQHLLARPEFGAGSLGLQALADPSPGPARHLYCNHSVPDDWLRRLDRALAATTKL